MITNTDSANKIFIYSGGSWQSVLVRADASSFLTTANSSTTPTPNYLSKWDANSNMFANNHVNKPAVTAAVFNLISKANTR